MSTSEHEGVILYDPTDLDTDEPADTVLVREIINNANHLADEAGQVRASWVAINAAIADPFLAPTPLHLTYEDDVLLAADGGWRDFAWRGGFDAKVRSDGTGYRLRVMLAGAADVDISSAVDFLIAVGPPHLGFEDAEQPHAPYDMVTGITTDAPGWLTLDSGLSYIDIPETVIAEARAREASLSSTLTDIAGDPTTVQTVRLEIMVCGRFANIGAKPVLYGVHVAEYIGP